MTEQRSRVYEAQLRLAAHYVDLVCKGCSDYTRGFEGSVAAVAVFNEERVQIEKSAAWLIRYVDRPEIGRLFVKLVCDGYQLLYACLPDEELRPWLEQSLATAEWLGDVGAQAKNLFALGWSVRRNGQIEASLPLFEQAYALALQVGDLRLQSGILNALGSLHQTRGELARAADCRQRAYELRVQLNDALGIHLYLYDQGDTLFQHGRWDEALLVFEQAYAKAVEAGGYREIARVLTNIGIVYKSQGRYAQATEVFEQALEFSECIQFPPVLVFTLHALADTYVTMNDLETAQTYYLQALNVAQQAKLTARIADIQAELGAIAYRYGAIDEAARYLDAALQTHRAQSVDYSIGVDLLYLALVYAAQGDYATARQAILESLRITVALNSDLWTLMPTFAALHLCILQALSATVNQTEQTALLQVAARWAGMVLAHPGVDQGKRDTFASLRPALEAVLGARRVDDLLKQGAALALETVVKEIFATL